MSNIPKTIHYCWFGGNPYPELMMKCLASWKNNCSDYQWKEWNESNFDITCNTYVRQAYEAKKWAFVTDYVRLYALYTEGGIYMDTDVEIIKPLDRFLNHAGFAGFESDEYVSIGLMGSQKEHPFIWELLQEYNTRTFINKDGTQDTTTNVIYITNVAKRYGLIQNGTKQTIYDFTFYPAEYFCPIQYKTGNINITENTYSIHHFSGSWHTEYDKKLRIKYIKYEKIFGKNIADRLTALHHSFHFEGINKTIYKIIKRIIPIHK